MGVDVGGMSGCAAVRARARLFAVSLCGAPDEPTSTRRSTPPQRAFQEWVFRREWNYTFFHTSLKKSIRVEAGGGTAVPFALAITLCARGTETMVVARDGRALQLQ